MHNKISTQFAYQNIIYRNIIIELCNQMATNSSNEKFLFDYTQVTKRKKEKLTPNYNK